MAEPFDIKVRALLMRRKGSWTTVARNAGVSYSWVTKFAAGHFENPGIGTLMRLHGALTKQPAARDKSETEATP